MLYYIRFCFLVNLLLNIHLTLAVVVMGIKTTFSSFSSFSSSSVSSSISSSVSSFSPLSSIFSVSSCPSYLSLLSFVLQSACPRADIICNCRYTVNKGIYFCPHYFRLVTSRSLFLIIY